MEKGILYKKFDEQVIKNFTKREFILLQQKEAGTFQWEEKIKFQLTKDNCNLLDNFDEGDLITVDFNIKGREWENKQGETMFFNTLEAWKITGEQN